MPYYDNTVSNEIQIEQALLQLADQLGPTSFQETVHRLKLFPSQHAQLVNTRSDVQLDEAKEYYLNSDEFLGLAESSQKAYRYEIDLFIKHCILIKGREVSVRNVSSALFLSEYLAPVKKLNTRNKKAAFLRSFLGEIHEHFFEENIEKLKRTLSVEVDRTQEPRAFSKEQLSELLSLVRMGREAHRNYVILWTFLGSGIRLSELCSLQVEDINRDRQEIMVRGKGKKGYKQPSKITKSALDLLCKYVKFRYESNKNESNYKERYIFSDDKGLTHIHKSTVQKMLNSLITEAKTIPESQKGSYQLSVHSLRHSFALFLLESGVNVYTIKELLRHAWLSSTEVYLKLFDSMLVTAIDKHPLSQLKIEELY